MWIGICDNDENFLNGFYDILARLVDENDLVTKYLSGFDLIETIIRNKESMDLIFLDINMPSFNGIQTAKEIRETNPLCIIVMVTNHSEYAIDCYEFNAFYYLLKPINKDALSKVLLKARILSDSYYKKKFHFKTKEAYVSLGYYEIIYFESYLRAIYVYTMSKKYKFTGEIGKIENQLKSQTNIFLRIHKSYIINVYHHKKILFNPSRIVLVTDIELPIASRRLNDVKNAIFDNLGV